VQREKVPRRELERIFSDQHVWEEIDNGNLVCAVEDKVVIPVGPRSTPNGGRQVIQKWKNVFGLHVATTHMVQDAEGHPIHWDEKDVLVGSVKYVHSRELDEAGPSAK